MSGPFLFVSHVSEDKTYAAELVSELERRGVACWIAPRDVRAGKPYDDEIAEAIDDCAAMLLIFSERCNESHYIRREITVAGEAQKLIIPFRIENAQPKKGLRIRLADLHWIDGFIAREQAIDALLRSVPSGRSALPVRQRHEPSGPQRPSALTTEVLTDQESGAGPATAIVKPAIVAAKSTHADLPAGAAASETRTPAKPADVSDPLERELIALTEEDVSTEGWSEANRSRLERARKGDPGAQFEIGMYYVQGALPQDMQRHAGWILKAAHQGFAKAATRIAYNYWFGGGVPKNPDRQSFWYRKGAEYGDPEAQLILAERLRDLKTERDDREAAYWARKSADGGHSRGLYLLGEFYADGIGVEPDPARAMEIFRKALSEPFILRNANALFQIGRLYERGLGVGQDLQQAAEWYTRAGTYNPAGDALKLLREKYGVVPKAGPYDNELLALTRAVVTTEGWPPDRCALADAAQRDDPAAQRSLARVYSDGDQDLPADATRAAAWLLRAALNGSSQAQLDLAEIFRKGQGVPEDPIEAFRWDFKLAEQGDAAAQYRVGRALDNGRNIGRKEDYAAAIEWYLKAGAQGVGEAYERIGELYVLGWGVEKDFVQAAVWHRKAYEIGERVIAPLYLGRFYENGEGCEQDLEEAAKWYVRAAKNPNAAEALARVKEKQRKAAGNTQQAS